MSYDHSRDIAPHHALLILNHGGMSLSSMKGGSDMRAERGRAKACTPARCGLCARGQDAIVSDLG